jgi:hypothetical protein
MRIGLPIATWPAPKHGSGQSFNLGFQPVGFQPVLGSFMSENLKIIQYPGRPLKIKLE